MTGKTLLYIFDHTDWKSRMPLALTAKDKGWNIVIGLVGNVPDNEDALAGIDHMCLPRPKTKFGPLATLKTIIAIRKLITKTKPDVLHTVTLKYAFLVGLACLGLSGFKRVYTIAGLGFLFRGEGIKPVIMRYALSPLLKLVLRDKNASLIIQNPDDKILLVKKGYARNWAAHLIIGSGVNLNKFEYVPEEKNETPIVLMPTRLVHEKGVYIFVEAARLLKSKNINADFQIAGGETKHNPKAISRAEMLQMTNDGAAEWLGRVEDMPGLLQKSAIIVYPSYYGEGVPRVLLEACASGRPVITTDHPGCREAVRDGENGYLVPVKNVEATAEAIEKLLGDAKQRAAMGAKSRQLAEDLFAVDHIVEQTLAVYG